MGRKSMPEYAPRTLGSVLSHIHEFGELGSDFLSDTTLKAPEALNLDVVLTPELDRLLINCVLNAYKHPVLWDNFLTAFSAGLNELPKVEQKALHSKINMTMI